MKIKELKDTVEEVRYTVTQWHQIPWGRITCSHVCFTLNIYIVARRLNFDLANVVRLFFLFCSC